MRAPDGSGTEASGSPGGSGKLSVDYSVVEVVRSRFSDLAVDLGSASDSLETTRSACLSGCGEFSAVVAGGLNSFMASWWGVFTVMGDSVGLVALNVGKYAVDLSQVDEMSQYLVKF
jgi:hypothetical protein